MALGLAPAERAIGIDRFDWPDAKIESRFLANCAAHGVMAERFVSWKADSREITPAMLRERLGGRAVRFAHIDSHHARECLTNDLELIHAVMHPDGIICLDDMLHPAYPMLAAAAFDYLARHTEMRLLCVIDREDIVAAPKFLICREALRGLYEHDLMEAFARFHFPLNADMESYYALALTPWPRLAEV
jgi:Methyltransferase domain